jgi:hypothetical protein
VNERLKTLRENQADGFRNRNRGEYSY